MQPKVLMSVVNPNEYMLHFSPLPGQHGVHEDVMLLNTVLQMKRPFSIIISDVAILQFWAVLTNTMFTLYTFKLLLVHMPFYM